MFDIQDVLLNHENPGIKSIRLFKVNSIGHNRHEVCMPKV